MHIITGKGSGVQFKAVRERLAALKGKLVDNYTCINKSGGFHVTLLPQVCSAL